MTAYGRVRFACELEEEVDFKRDLASLLIVEDVRYRPRRWSWEVQQRRRIRARRASQGHRSDDAALDRRAARSI